MTPTTKHIEEARRFADHICLDTERDVVVQKLSTLLAAQEELETTKKRCELLLIQQGHDEEARDEMAKRNALLHNINDQLRAERDELKQVCANRDATVKAQGDEWVKLKTEIDQLRTHNAALLAVARAARINHVHCYEYCPICNALSALEPLGIIP